MESVLVKVAETTSPAAMASGTNPALKSVSHVSMASDLFKAFTDDDLENTKLSVLRHMALVQGLTIAQFGEEVKLAQKLADEADAMNGFKPAEHPKSMDERYGLKRRVLNQRMSEAKNLFGVFKQEPSILKEKGYWACLQAARNWLKANGKTWEGDTALSATDKAVKAEKKALAKAIGAAVADGVSIEGAVEAAKHQVAEDKLASFINKLVKDTDGNVLITACLRILESQSSSDIQGYIEYLSEAKMLIDSDTTPE